MNLGTLLGISPQHLIIRCHEWDESKSSPAIEEAVYDSNKRHIGHIADIFGPVSKPFISIALNKKSGLKLEDFTDKKGDSFYTLPNVKKSSFELKRRTYNKQGTNIRKPTRPPKKSATSPSQKD